MQENNEKFYNLKRLHHLREKALFYSNAFKKEEEKWRINSFWTHTGMICLNVLVVAYPFLYGFAKHDIKGALSLVELI